MKLLVTGGGGQLGRALTRLAAAAGHELRAPTRAELDIADDAALRDACAWAEVVINAAAYTDVNRAESERETAFAVNAAAPGRLAEHCAAGGSLPLHVSTDYVFDGRAQRPWRETDPTGPLSIYGESKRAGEDAVRAALEHHLIVRTSWVYSETGRNFLTTMLRLGAEREELSVVDDQIGTPTSAEDLAAALLHLAVRAREEEGPFGTYHYSAEGTASWADFAEAIFAEAGDLLPERPRIERIESSAYPTPARRPAYSVLDCSRIVADFDPPRRAWQQGLSAVMARLKLQEVGQEKMESR